MTSSSRKPTTQNRAPKGGCEVNGKFYRGGQFIPTTASVPAIAAPKATKAPALKRLVAALKRAEMNLSKAGKKQPRGGMLVVAAREEYDAAALAVRAARLAA